MRIVATSEQEYW